MRRQKRRRRFLAASLGSLLLACGGELNAGWNDVVQTPPEPSAGEVSDAAVKPPPTPSRDASEPVPPDAATPVHDAGDGGMASDAAVPSTPPPDALLPVGPDNPLLLYNDGHVDSWQGEAAILFAATTGPELAGIVVTTSVIWSSLDDNVANWRAMIEAARGSGIAGLPDPIGSEAATLIRPASGEIDETQATFTAGAKLIVDLATTRGSADLPLVVVTGTRLTDIANAYLVEPSIADRVVVISSLGSLTSDGADMAAPNGEFDPWADVVVASRLRYIQVSAHYDQLKDLPEDFIDKVPSNAFGEWVVNKQPDVWTIPEAADQVGVLSVALPDFPLETIRTRIPEELDGVPALKTDPLGPVTVVSAVDGDLAGREFRRLLTDPATYLGP